MNDPANTYPWQIGDLVIHDADRKCADMLMRVIAIRPDGQRVTEYAHGYGKARWGDKIWTNDLAYLHDPARFGIVLNEDVA